MEFAKLSADLVETYATTSLKTKLTVPKYSRL